MTSTLPHRRSPGSISESPWKLGGLTKWEVLRRSVISYRRHRVGAHSAQFAYYSLLALVPLLVLIVASVAQLPLKGTLDTFLRTVHEGLPPSAVELIKNQIRDIQREPPLGPVVVALMLLGYAGSGLFMSIGAGLDVVYEVQERRRFVWTGIRALALTLGGYLLFLTAVILLVIGPMVTEMFLRHVDVAWVHVVSSAGVRFAVACGAILLASSATYWAIPSVRPKWRLFTPGSVFATTAWLVVTLGLRVWVVNFGTYNETYGALAGVIVLLFWLYLTGSVLLMGGQIDGVIRVAADRALQASDELPKQ